MIIKGYRYSETGKFGYDFYGPNGNCICKTHSIPMPFFNTVLSGWGLSWRSIFDFGDTLVPGIRRSVFDIDTRERVAFVIYRDIGNFEIVHAEECVQVKAVENQYLYLKNEQPVAICKRVDKSTDRVERHSGEMEELRFVIALQQDDLSDAWKLLILTFPNLQFAP